MHVVRYKSSYGYPRTFNSANWPTFHTLLLIFPCITKLAVFTTVMFAFTNCLSNTSAVYNHNYIASIVTPL